MNGQSKSRALGDWLLRFRPEEPAPPALEGVIAALSAAAAIVAVIGASMALLDSPLPVVGSIGASACLVFCLPTSPLAQPWSILGAYTISAFIGVVAAQTGLPLALAGAIAVGGATFAMLALRCLHAPGAAVAMYAVVGDPRIAALGYKYVLTPVLVNALLLVGVALLVNNAIPGRHYPRRINAAHGHTKAFTAHDLHAALADYGHPLAMSEEDLDAIITLAERNATTAGAPPGRPI